MNRSAFYISLLTDPTPTAEYTLTANSLVEALASTLGDQETLLRLLKTKTLARATVEVEVRQTEPKAVAPIVASAVLDLDAASKVNFDKNSFSAMIREALDFPVKISKRAIGKEELPPLLA